MKHLVLKSRSGGFGEILTDIAFGDFKEIYEENNDRSLEFTIHRTLRNKDIFDNLIPDMLLEWRENDYTITSVEENEKNLVRTKIVTAKHVFMESQFIYIDKDLSQEMLNDDLTGTEESDTDTGTVITGSLVNPVADTVFNFLIGKGLREFQVFGVLGNMQAESGLNPSAEQYPGNYNLGGKGLVQWDDRKYNLYDYAEANNKQWQDLQLQLSFMWHELMTTESYAYDKLINSTNIEDATLKFHDFYERSADTETMKQRRVRFAKELEAEYNGSLNREKANSSYLDMEKGLNFPYDPDGTNPDYPFNGPHLGIDLDYIYDDVYSVIAGKVTVGFESGGFGNYVLINAGNGLEVIYAHLSEIDVAHGQVVRPGTLLGVSGNTGRSSGPHLHFEMKQDGVAFNPLPWIEENKYGTSEDEFDDSDNSTSDNFENMVPTYTIREYLDYGFKDNVFGFTYEVIGEFPKRQEVKEIGGKNLLQHLTDGAEIFNYLYFAQNRHIKIYAIQNYYEMSNDPIIYRYNTSELKVKTDIKDLETYIAGYGAKKTTKETKNYTPIKTSGLTFSGTFIKTGTYRTERVGNSYTATINAKWGNEMLEWSMKKGKLGGVVEVYLDGTSVGTFDTYSEDTKTEKVIVGTKVNKGKHIIKVVFRGASNRGSYDDKTPVMYVGSKKGTVFNSSAILSGKDIYKWFAEHKSPNYDNFRYRQAPTVYADKVDTEQDLYDQLIETINDEPTVEVSTSYVGNDDIKENSMVRLVHKPMGFNTDLRVVKLTRPHPYAHKRIEVEFNNSTSTILQIQKQLSINLQRLRR